MTLHELSRAPVTPRSRRRRVPGLRRLVPGLRRLVPGLRRLAELWWLGVRTHVAEAHGLPRPEAPPPPWPFRHL